MRRTSVGVHGQKDGNVDDVLRTTPGMGIRSSTSDIVDLLQEVRGEPVGSVTSSGADAAVAIEPGRQRTPQKRRRATALHETISPVRLFLLAVQTETTTCRLHPR